MKEFGMSTSNLALKGSTMELFSIKTPLLDSKETFGDLKHSIRPIMTDLSKGTKLCANCGQNVNLASFVMHENFCIKNIVKCQICQMPYDKNMKDDHFDEYHAVIDCECGEKIERMHLEHHKTELCPKRKATCFFCELTLAFDKLEEHLDYCGARTEKCTVCNRYVQLKDKYKHETSNCEYPPVPVKPARSNRPLARQTDAQDPGAAAGQSGRQSAASVTGSMVYLPCEFCDELFPNTMLMHHQDQCEANPMAMLHYQLAHANLLNMFDRADATEDILDDDQMGNLGSLLREMESMQAANTRAHSTINKINSTLALVDDGTDKTTCQYCRKDIETRLLPIHERDCKEKKNSLSPRRHAAKKSTNDLSFNEVDANLNNILKINNKSSSQDKQNKNPLTRPDVLSAHSSRFDPFLLDPPTSNRSEFSKKDAKSSASAALPTISRVETKSFILPKNNATISIGSLPIQSKPHIKSSVVGRNSTRPSGTRLRMQDPVKDKATCSTTTTTKPPSLAQPSRTSNANSTKPGANVTNASVLRTRSLTPALNPLGPIASSVKPLNPKPK